MDLIIHNKIIEVSIADIITTLRAETGYKYFNQIGKDGLEHLQVQCPYHKNGQERNMSASFYNDSENDEVEYGMFHCFTCGKSAPLYKVVNHCFGKEENDEFGKNWLVDNFGSIIPANRQLKPLREKKPKAAKIIIDESVLDDYNYIHPYMYKRKLTDEVIAKYKIGYDPEAKAITFPCWDKNGNLVAINRRSVQGKSFDLAASTNKEVYLLNYALAEGATTVFVMESQLNALSFMAKYPGTHAVALLGTGCAYQYQILNRSGIRNYILMLDGDSAGHSGVERFKKNVKGSCIITNINMPNGKDVNDLVGTEELDHILLTNGITTTS